MSKFNEFIKVFQGNPTNLFALLGLALLVVAFLLIRKVKFSTQIITQIAIALALAAVLDMFKLFRAPFGGDVTIGAMVPILLLAIIYGPEVGFITGFLYGIISLILGPYVVHPVQLLFDYPLAFMALGLAGYVAKSKSLGNLVGKFTKSDKNSAKSIIVINIIATLVGIFGRFICHFISGVVFFASDTPAGMSTYLYSFLYNISYLGIDAVICLIIISLIPVGQLRKMMIKK